MAIKYTDFLPYTVLTAAEVQSLQDSVVVQVDTIVELDDVPSTVYAAYCLEDSNLYTYNGAGWAIVATQDHVSAEIAATGAYQNWTPTLTASTTNPTNWLGTGRYTQIGKHVSGWGKVTAQTSFTTGSGNWRFSLPVAPKQTTEYPRVGYGMVYNNNTWFGYIQMELQSNQNYTQAMVTGLAYEDNAGKLASYTNPNKYGWQKYKTVDSTFMTSDLGGASCQVGAVISWQFDYEAL